MIGFRLAHLLSWIVLTTPAPGKAQSEGNEGLDSRVRCSIVAAVLDAKFDSGKREYFAPASEQKCALVNGYKNGTVLVHPFLEGSRDSQKERHDFIAPGTHCGQRVLVVSTDWLRSRARRPVNVVAISLKRIDERTFEYFEYIEVVQPGARPRKNELVSTGTSCAPEWGGRVQQEQEVWTARIHEETPWHPACESKEECDKLKQDMLDAGFAPGWQDAKRRKK
jgi:hypothetical protein